MNFTQFLSSVRSSDEFDKEIRDKVGEATNIALDEQKAKNAHQNLNSSTIGGFIIFLKTLLLPFVTAVVNTPSYLLEVVAGAFDGFAKDGLIGLLGSFAKIAVFGLREMSTQIGENILKGK